MNHRDRDVSQKCLLVNEMKLTAEQHVPLRVIGFDVM